MANERFIMRQMEVKGKRLAYGLRKFVEAYESGNGAFDVAYAYALGCIGDDKSKAKLVRLCACQEVYSDLSSQGMVKKETAEKLIAENHKLMEGSETRADEILDVQPEKQTALETVETPVAASVESEPEAAVEQPCENYEFKVVYDNGARRMVGYIGTDENRKAYDRMLEYFTSGKKFPTEFKMDDDSAWIRSEVKDEGNKLYTVTYSKGI